jgi:recyclin-1
MEYISVLLENAHIKDVNLYLRAAVTTHQHCIHVAKVLWKDAKPGLTKIRAEDLMYQMFESFMDKYLKEELNFVKAQSKEEIEKWNQKVTMDMNCRDPLFLAFAHYVKLEFMIITWQL